MQKDLSTLSKDLNSQSSLFRVEIPFFQSKKLDKHNASFLRRKRPFFEDSASSPHDEKIEELEIDLSDVIYYPVDALKDWDTSEYPSARKLKQLNHRIDIYEEMMKYQRDFQKSQSSSILPKHNFYQAKFTNPKSEKNEKKDFSYLRREQACDMLIPGKA